MNRLLQEIHDSVLEGDRLRVKVRISEAIQANLPPREILESMSQSMAKVGSLFEEGDYFVPEMLIAARAMQDGMEILKPWLVETDIKTAGVVVAGTVKGDLHEIGKNLVCMMLECAGFTVIDLGSDVAPEKFIQAVIENQPDIVAMSALLTTTMSYMQATIESLRSAGLRDKVKIMIGGAPVTEVYAVQIAADGYAKDASRAVKTAKRLLSKAAI